MADTEYGESGREAEGGEDMPRLEFTDLGDAMWTNPGVYDVSRCIRDGVGNESLGATSANARKTADVPTVQSPGQRTPAGPQHLTKFTGALRKVRD